MEPYENPGLRRQLAELTGEELRDLLTAEQLAALQVPPEGSLSDVEVVTLGIPEGNAMSDLAEDRFGTVRSQVLAAAGFDD